MLVGSVVSECGWVGGLKPSLRTTNGPKDTFSRVNSIAFGKAP